jgi:hypothetical protein
MLPLLPLSLCVQVDASYLSPHVTLSDTLEAATKQYGIPILMSGQFVSNRARACVNSCAAFLLRLTVRHPDASVLCSLHFVTF